jgi:tRNA (cmo5U34)-methyltransferase
MESDEKFDRIADTYDTGVRSLPQYDQLRKVLFDIIPFSKDAKANVLDLGIGTGTTAAEFLERYPNVRLTGVDSSSKMLEHSHQKLEKFSARAELIQCSFEDFVPNGQFDLVYSILALHHVPDEDKETLFRKIQAILKSNSALIIIDLVNGASDELTKRYQSLTFGLAHKEKRSA